MHHSLKQLIQCLRYAALGLVVAMGFLSIIASGGGADGGPPPSQNTGTGFITIEQPTSAPTYVIEAEKIFMSGEAFISPTFFVCCTGSASDTGVKVSWVNETTGINRRASQTADYCGFSLCGHHWSAQVPLAPGVNQITVTASDESGNVGRKTIAVTRIDVTAPTVTLSSPAPNETEVALNTLIEVAFSEGLDSTTVNSNTFLLRDDTNTPVDGTVTYHGVVNCPACGKLATFTPSNSLSPSTIYTATLTTGIQDLAGHPLAQAYSWQFTTGLSLDVAAPTVSATDPVTGATCASIDAPVTVTFDESMDASSINANTFLLRDDLGGLINGTVSYSGLAATLVPNVTLKLSSPYTATVTTGAKDLAGNSLLADHSWSFTTTAGQNGNWQRISSLGSPESRYEATTIWTGTEMIVWGGSVNSEPVKTGGRYDPLTDTWVPTSTVSAPSGRYSHVAVWTGTEMIVWGGAPAPALPDAPGTGGRYNPSTDSWSAISTVNAPLARQRFAAVWTGSEMIVWGGQDSEGQLRNTGARYDPTTDSWSAISTVNAPSARSGHTAVWTGNEMIVWGGNVSSGARYDPGTDTWQPLSIVNAPSVRTDHTAVWSGTEMIVWGGLQFPPEAAVMGAKYAPSTDTWQPVTTQCAPSPRWGHTAVWTGDRMIIWGGSDGQRLFDTGGAYDPVSETWLATVVLGAPSATINHTAVWSGTEMIVWNSSTRGGGRYKP